MAAIDSSAAAKRAGPCELCAGLSGAPPSEAPALQLLECETAVSVKKECNAATTCAPSPTAAATRFTDLARTSPMAKTPGRLVSRPGRAAIAGAHETLVV